MSLPIIPLVSKIDPVNNEQCNITVHTTLDPDIRLARDKVPNDKIFKVQAELGMKMISLFSGKADEAREEAEEEPAPKKPTSANKSPKKTAPRKAAQQKDDEEEGDPEPKIPGKKVELKHPGQKTTVSKPEPTDEPEFASNQDEPGLDDDSAGF